MNRGAAVALLDRLHQAQNEFYAGGHGAELCGLLTPDVIWTVPGQNLIAGNYRRADEVFRYFERRRQLAHRTFQMTRRDILVGTGNRVAALTDGSATINGGEQTWSTVGLYELAGERIARCWLLPLNQQAFDKCLT
jgi:ketosteroid isomerase-like protein